MSGRAGIVRLWALLSAGWMLGLNLLLGFVILKYRSVLWGWLGGSLEQGLARGVTMAALKMTLRGDLFTLGRTDVEALLAREGRDISR